jgi:hypothetical protein
VVIANVAHWNYSFIQREDEAPLDHLYTSLIKPFYYACPTIEGNPTSNTTTHQYPPPPVVMISARPPPEVAPVLSSWEPFFHPTLYQTANFSRSFENTRCRQAAWKSRLFAVYQHVLTHALATWPEARHFVVLEDDVVLLKPVELQRELAWAIQQDLEYYSFFRTSKTDGSNGVSSGGTSSCLYESGTPSQVISRRFAQRILDADTDSFCRLPIDMFIAHNGPYYVTQQALVQHVGKRWHAPLNKRR